MSLPAPQTPGYFRCRTDVYRPPVELGEGSRSGDRRRLGWRPPGPAPHASTPTAAMGPRSRFAASCCTAWRPLRRAGLPSQPSWPRATAERPGLARAVSERERLRPPVHLGAPVLAHRLDRRAGQGVVGREQPANRLLLVESAV